MTGKRIAITVIVFAAAALAVLFLLQRAHRVRIISEAQTIPIEGAVIQKDANPQNQLPIGDVAVTASDGVNTATAQSQGSGYFKLDLPKGVLSERPVTVSFRHDGYEPLDLTIQTGRLAIPKRLYIAAMSAAVPKVVTKLGHPDFVVSNIRVRYTINARSETNVGSAVRTFQVVNQGDVPCDHHSLCSPDGKWKAASAEASLDAGADNSFGNIRASCIAGPCPFTRIDSSGLLPGKRNITVKALNWSDTTTFLMQAEVFHTAISSNLRELYPVIFGPALNFTVPPSQEGVSLEADLDGAPMVFPLGPNLSLSWASCTVRSGTEEEQTMAYRCELKPGYRF